MICESCNEPILPGEDRADIITMDVHRECALRNVMGGIGHLIDHGHFCREKHDPDAGLDRRTSSLLVDVWIARQGVEEAVKIGGRP